MVFAWRATMPTFTDASLIAAGAGALVWTLLAVEASTRRRTVVGLLGFLALEGATFIRYTDVVELAVAVVAVCAFARSARLRWRNVAWWLSSVALFGGLVLVFDALVYGGATRTGYSSGEITFSASALVPNLENMPAHLLRTMPLALVAVGAVIWIVARLVTARRAEMGERSRRRRDACVAGSLVAGWIGIWGLYAAYTWTVTMGAGGIDSDVHVVRFYVPALGLMALLGAWLLTRIPGWFASPRAATPTSRWRHPVSAPGAGSPAAAPAVRVADCPAAVGADRPAAVGAECPAVFPAADRQAAVAAICPAAVAAICPAAHPVARRAEVLAAPRGRSGAPAEARSPDGAGRTAVAAAPCGLRRRGSRSACTSARRCRGGTDCRP
jgi:uncharacterized protein YjeT (DUF2065 family)